MGFLFVFIHYQTVESTIERPPAVLENLTCVPVAVAPKVVSVTLNRFGFRARSGARDGRARREGWKGCYVGALWEFISQFMSAG